MTDDERARPLQYVDIGAGPTILVLHGYGMKPATYLPMARLLADKRVEPFAIDTVVGELREQGYLDDASYALAKSRSLTGRGYGKRRLTDALRAAGVREPDSEAARNHADEEAIAAAIRFAERRRLGPFARADACRPVDRDKALGAMIRAGHGFAIARAIVAMVPAAEVDAEALAEDLREVH